MNDHGNLSLVLKGPLIIPTLIKVLILKSDPNAELDAGRRGRGLKWHGKRSENDESCNISANLALFIQILTIYIMHREAWADVLAIESTEAGCHASVPNESQKFELMLGTNIVHRP